MSLFDWFVPLKSREFGDKFDGLCGTVYFDLYRGDSGEHFHWQQPNTLTTSLFQNVANLIANAAYAGREITWTQMSTSGGVANASITTTQSVSGAIATAIGTFLGALTMTFVRAGTGAGAGYNVGTVYGTTAISLTLGASDSLVVTWTVQAA